MIAGPKSITSKSQFLETLCADLKLNPEEWENTTLERFLDAMGAWVASYESCYCNAQQIAPLEPNWAFFAQALTAARTYE
jgi:hypothetical protein